MSRSPTPAKIIGCLLGQSVADALGLCTRGLTSGEASRLVDELIATWFAPAPSTALPERLYITESSQLTWEIIRLVTEQKGFDAALFSRRIVALFNRRIVMQRCLETHLAVQQLRAGKAWNESGIDSRACGSLPRAAATGVAFWADEGTRRSATERQCQVTHSNREVVAASVVVAELVAHLLCSEWGAENPSLDLAVPVENGDLERELARIPELLQLEPDEALRVIAPQAEVDGLADDIYQGLLWAMYCAVRNNWDFAAAVCCALKAGGELVAPVAVVGAFCGAACGQESLPDALSEIVTDRGVYFRTDFVRWATLSCRHN